MWIINNMKNIVLKYGYYNDYGFFSHIYFLDVNYDFNEKTINEIVEFVSEEPFSDVMIHANDLNYNIIEVLKEISKLKNIWFESKTILFEDFAVMEKESMEILGINKISIMIDGLGDVINFKKSIKENSLVKFNYKELPF